MAVKKPWELLADWLKRTGRKQNWVAWQLDVHPGTLSRWVASSDPPEEIRAKLSEITGGAVPKEGSWR